MMLFWRIWYSGRVLRWIILALPLLLVGGFVTLTGDSRGPGATPSPTTAATVTSTPESAASNRVVMSRRVSVNLDESLDVRACLPADFLVRLGAAAPGSVRRYALDEDRREVSLDVYRQGQAAASVEVDYPTSYEGATAVLRFVFRQGSTEPETATVSEGVLMWRFPFERAKGTLGVAVSGGDLVRVAVAASYVSSATGNSADVNDGAERSATVFDEALGHFERCGLLSGL
jgi:hypothetical protein